MLNNIIDTRQFDRVLADAEINKEEVADYVQFEAGLASLEILTPHADSTNTVLLTLYSFSMMGVFYGVYQLNSTGNPTLAMVSAVIALVLRLLVDNSPYKEMQVKLDSSKGTVCFPDETMLSEVPFSVLQLYKSHKASPVPSLIKAPTYLVIKPEDAPDGEHPAVLLNPFKCKLADASQYWSAHRLFMSGS